MWHCAFEHWHTEKILLCGLCTLCDGCCDFTGLAQTVSNHAFTIANHHDGGESESTTTLGDLGHAIQSHKSVLQLLRVFYLCSIYHNFFLLF